MVEAPSTNDITLNIPRNVIPPTLTFMDNNKRDGMPTVVTLTARSSVKLSAEDKNEIETNGLNGIYFSGDGNRNIVLLMTEYIRVIPADSAKTILIVDDSIARSRMGTYAATKAYREKNGDSEINLLVNSVGEARKANYPTVSMHDNGDTALEFMIEYVKSGGLPENIVLISDVNYSDYVIRTGEVLRLQTGIEVLLCVGRLFDLASPMHITRMAEYCPQGEDLSDFCFDVLTRQISAERKKPAKTTVIK